MKPGSESAGTNGASKPYSNGVGLSDTNKSSSSASKNGTHDFSNILNSPPNMNGHSSTNGKQKPTYFGHDREEVSRILMQALTDLGFHGAAASLSQESGYEFESPAVAAFKNAVLQGEWNEAEDLLFGAPSNEGGVSLNGYGLALQEDVDKDIMRFWLRQQKYLELLEQRDTGRALMVLRTELTPLYQDTSKLHFLSSLLMCSSTEELKEKADWDGAHGQSRYYLLSELSRCISPSVMLPEHRLAVLLHQVKRTQIANCLYHSTSLSPSLYQDHICEQSNFPSTAIVELDTHTDEVWDVHFSHDGTRLASCGADGSVIIYDAESFEQLHTLAGPDRGVCSLSWSPDDATIITCSRDNRARLWDTHTGDMVRSLTRFGEPVSSSVWAPDGRSFVTGCLDKDRNLCQWSVDGDLIYDWGQNHRVQDLAVSPDGHYLVAIDNACCLYVYNFDTRDLIYKIEMRILLSSVDISRDSKTLLAMTVDGDSRLIDLETRETLRVFRSGEEKSQNVIKATFGGADESFVITGSESGAIYIWHKDNGTLIEKLDGHDKGNCSAVSWHPSNPCMFASAGDDRKVRIWSNKDSGIKRASRASHSNGIASNGW